MRRGAGDGVATWPLPPVPSAPVAAARNCARVVPPLDEGVVESPYKDVLIRMRRRSSALPPGEAALRQRADIPLRSKLDRVLAGLVQPRHTHDRDTKAQITGTVTQAMVG